MRFFSLAALVSVFSTANADVRPPNVIVILTDDLGYADLGVQQKTPDIRTPRLDQLAAEGVRCTAAYSTAPQCSPSRVALLTGRYQQEFGIDEIPDLPLPLSAVTLPERLKEAGYLTGMSGKWHLEPTLYSEVWIQKNPKNRRKNVDGKWIVPVKLKQAFYPGAQGFDSFFTGDIQKYYANIDLEGNPVPPAWLEDTRFRVDVQTDAALAFLTQAVKRDKPFFLYVSYFAPHTPMEVPEPYVAQFPDQSVQRRRSALAMISAVDHGSGRIFDFLEENGLDENTLIFFTSDNGAPLKKKRDTPLSGDLSGWDGSLNHPLVGEKGMLSEGGIRVPFIAKWPGKIPSGQIYSKPISLLDIAATTCAAAGLPPIPELDGVNLMPYFEGRNQADPHAALYWRFWTQAAIRKGKWKLLTQPDGPDMLFDMDSPEQENKDLAAETPATAAELRSELTAWTQTLRPPGIHYKEIKTEETNFFREHFPDRPRHHTPPPASHIDTPQAKPAPAAAP